MKIAIDGTTLRARDGGPGAGIEHYTRMIAEALANEAPGRVRLVPMTGRVPFISRHLLVPFRAALSGADMLFCPSGHVPIGWLGRATVVVHDLAVYEHPEWFPAPGSSLDARSLGRAERVIAISEATRAQIGRLFPEAVDKVRVVYPGGGEGPAERRFAGEQDVVLHVGTIEPRKNLVNAVAAFDAFLRLNPDRSRTTRLVLAGAVGWKAEDALEAVEQTNAVWRAKAGAPVVRTLGYVTEEEKRALYAQASCLLFPSWYEGFGLPALEAMASGCPVITTEMGALPEVCGDAAIFVRPDDPRQMALAIAQCVMLPDAMGEMVEHARRRAEQFTWKRAAREILSAMGDA